jgi:HD domain
LRVLYRAGQFWQALTATPATEELNQARQVLAPQLMALFLNQPASEQVHSLRVFTRLCLDGVRSTDLLAAALLHDVGKSRYPLRIWERVLVVIGQALVLCQDTSRDEHEPHGWKRPFIIASRHANWGAEMAAEAGASHLTVELIRRHHDPLAGGLNHPDDQLLHRLQMFDHSS